MFCFTPTKDGYEQHSEESAVDLAFWKPHLDTDYDSDHLYFSLLYV